MPKEDEVIFDKAGQESQQSEQEREESKPRNAEQWLVSVRTALQDVLPPEKIQEMERVLAMAKAAKEMQQADKKPAGHEIREFFEELDIKEIEKLLKQLEQLPKASQGGAPEVILYKHELEEVRSEATRRHVDSGSIAATTRGGSLEKQVFENFSKYLEEGAVIKYGGDRLEVHRTADGALIITVPSASFENMLALAGELGNLKEQYSSNPEDYAQMLMTAALIMDQQAIYSKSAIEDLYNAGYKLQQIANKARTDEYINLETIQRIGREEFGKPGWQEKVDKAYLAIFLGKHDVKFVFEDGKLQIQKTPEQARGEKARKLYDVLFDQWQKSDEGKVWLQQNKGLLNRLDDPSVIVQITKAYDEWLCKSDRRENLLRRMKGFMEQKVNPAGAEGKKYELLFSKWRHMLVNSEGIGQIKAQIDQQIGQRSLPDIEQLQIITKLFQPNGQITPDALKYVPAEVLKIFQNRGSTAQQRNEAACIIADSYVKTILQDRGFGVFTQLVTTDTGGHTRLIAVSKKDGSAYFVDPNKPGVAVEQIPVGSKILEQLREEIPADEQKPNGDLWQMKHGVLIQDKGSVIADGNALLTSGFLTNMIDEAKTLLGDEVKFAAAQRAASLFPDNPVAWLQMAKYSTGDKQKEEYFERAVGLGFDRNTAERLLEKDQKIRVGAWAPGGPGAVPAGSPYAAIVAQANVEIIANGGGPVDGLEKLSLEELDELRKLIVNQVRDDTTAGNPIPPVAQTMLNEIVQAFADVRTRQELDRGPQLFTALTPRQINTLERGSAQDIHNLVEEQIRDVSREIQTGAYLNQNAQESIQDKLRPLRQFLDARMSSPRASQEIQREREYVVNVIQLYSGLTNVIGLIQSGDAKQVEQAVGLANQMDTEGGLIVYHTVSTMHEGRPQGLVSDFRREMQRVMQVNFQREVDAQRPGRYYMTQEDYLRLAPAIVEQQVNIAMAGIGQYEKFRHENANPGGQLLVDPANPADPAAALDYQKKKIHEQIDVDIKLAQMLFEATGEASAIYIQGRMPDNIYDGGAMMFLNAQWQNLWRYFEITELNREVAKLQFEDACREHLAEVEDERTKQLIKRMLKDKGLFDRYIEANALNILAPQVNFWWENRFLRTIPMIKSLNEYENAVYAGIAGRVPVEYIKIIRKGVNEPVFVPRGGSPEFGILLRAFLYGGGEMYSGDKHSDRVVKDEQLSILRGKAAEYFPDILIEPFSRQSAVEYTDKGIPADRRFVELFGGGAAAFLDVGVVPAAETTYQRAVRRFSRFQSEYRPKMDAIRNKRINNPTGNPVQTNFALNNGLPQSAWVDVQTAFGGSAKNFRLFIASMQELARGTDPLGEDGFAYALAYDPLFENQWYSPMSLIDVPMWMLDGDDLMTSNQAAHVGAIHGIQVKHADRHDPLRIQLGGRDRAGRQFKDVLELGEKTRAGLIELLKATPNSVEGARKIVEKMSEGIGNTRGSPLAHEVEMMALGKFLKMNYPQVADWFGFKDGFLFFRPENTAYRKIMGSRVGSLSKEQLFVVSEQIIANWPEKAQRKFRRKLKTRTWDRVARQSEQSIFIFLLSVIFGTGEAIFGAINPAEQAA